MAKQGEDKNPNLGRDEGTPMDAKTAFEQSTNAKVCYVNKQGHWLFSNPDKSFGEVVKTFKRDEDGKITEQGGFRQTLEHAKSDEENKRNGRKDSK